MRPTSSKSLLTAATLLLLALAVGAPTAGAQDSWHHKRPSRHRVYRPLHRDRVPNLALRLSGAPGSVMTGQQVTYSATIVNTGHRTVRNAGFRDQIPNQAAWVSTNATQGSCNGNQAIVCNLGSLARGGSATVTIVVTANQPGTMTDQGWVSDHPPRGWYHEHHVSTQVQGSSASLGLTLNGPGSADQGQNVTYTATVTNSGNAAAPNAAFQDLLPGKATYVSASPSQGSCTGNPDVICNLGSIGAGGSATVTIVVTASKPGWMTDRGWVSANPPGNWQHQRVVHTFVHEVSANVDLKLAGSPGTVDQGQNVTYTATVTDNGNGAAPSVAFQDLLPGKATFVSSSASQGSCSGTTTVLCDLGSLNAGASATVTIVVTASQPGWMTDRGWVSANPPGNWQHQRVVSTYVRQAAPNPSLSLSGSPGTVDKGSNVTYTATIKNGGNAAAPTVAFQDLLPGKASLVSANASQGSCTGSPIVLCNLGSLAAGATATVTIVVTANAPGPMTDHGWISVNPPGNWQQEKMVFTFVRDVNPALALRLSGSPGSVTTGQPVTYTATVTNTGNGTDANAGFQDQLPAGTSLGTVTTSQGSCSGSPMLLCNLGSLAPGASATITIVVTPSQAGTITDRAWVSTNPPGSWQHEHQVQTVVHAAPVTPTVTTATTTTGH
jgi:uncharacterized repeat protein (TIGR01451 family)